MSAPVIEVERLRRTFGAFVAVNDISFSVPAGQIFGFLGANGAGKSTAIRMLTGLLQPTGGRALVGGRDVATDPEGVKRRIGYMSQRFSLYDDLTVWENLGLYAGIYDLRARDWQPRARVMLDELALTRQRDERVVALPLGMKQRLAFSTALLHQPPVVFLDEPTGGVDPVARRQFWELIDRRAAEGTTVLVTTHYMDEAEYCDAVGIMVAGKLEALGTPAALKAEFAVATMDDVFVRLARPTTGVAA